MAKLMRYAMNNKIFRDIVSTKKYILKTNYKSYIWHNKNKLLKYDYITGGKTGYTKKARRTLVSTGSKNNINIVVVTLNDPDDWLDHKNTYENIFKKYKNYLLINKNNYKIKDDYYKDYKLYINNNIYMTLNKNELKKVSSKIEIYKMDNIIDESIVGYINIILNNKIYHKEPIYIKEIDKDDNLTIIEKIRKWIYKW